MLIFDRSLGAYEQAVITACNSLLERLSMEQSGKHRFPASLYKTLSEILTQEVADPYAINPPYAVIAYDPKTTAYAYAGGTCIWIGDKTFQDSHPMRLPAVLLHELIHVACGIELDSEAVENFMFYNVNGATLTLDDLKDIIHCSFRGRWYRVVKKDANAQEAIIKNCDDQDVFIITPNVVPDQRGLPIPDQKFNEFLDLVPIEA